MSKEAVFTMKLEPELRDAFMAEALASHRPASQVMRELMRDFVQHQREARSTVTSCVPRWTRLESRSVPATSPGGTKSRPALRPVGRSCARQRVMPWTTAGAKAEQGVVRSHENLLGRCRRARPRRDP
jgi:hypothetical protein